MQIQRPDSLAVLYRTFRWSQGYTLSIGMLACFPFGASQPEELRPEGELWAAVTAALGENAVLDEGYPKPAAEFKLYGTAWAPGGQPVTELGVRVRVGPLSKQLVISGERHFNAAGLITGPAPFTHLPITPENAFGGPDCQANPVGQGQAPLAAGPWPLPQVETPSGRLANRGDSVEPAGFWGLPVAAPQRLRHLGACDQAWLQQRWPHLPQDTDPAYFMTAPHDQRLASYFQGGEALEMQHLHPQQPQLSCRLPVLRARCILRRRLADGTDTWTDLDTRAETLWLFPEQECGIILHRAHLPTADEQASDILALLADWESLEAPPRPLAHYTVPWTSPEHEAAPADTTAHLPTPRREPYQPQLSRDAVLERHGQGQSLSGLDLSGLDLSGLSLTGADFSGCLLAGATFAGCRLTTACFDGALLLQADFSTADLSHASLANVSAGESRFAQAQLQDAQLQGGDFTSADFSGADLRSATLNNALFHGARMTGVRAAGCTAQECSFADADLSDADFRQARLQGAQFHSGRLEAADFTAADCKGAEFYAVTATRSRFTQASLHDSRADGASNFSGADFTNAQLPQAHWSGAQLSDSTWQGAILDDADFSAVQAQRADLRRASAKGMRLSGANLAEADLSGINLFQGSLRQSCLERTWLRQANLYGVDFEGTQPTIAQLEGANIDQTVLAFRPPQV